MDFFATWNQLQPEKIVDVWNFIGTRIIIVLTIILIELVIAMTIEENRYLNKIETEKLYEHQNS